MLVIVSTITEKQNTKDKRTRTEENALFTTFSSRYEGIAATRSLHIYFVNALKSFSPAQKNFQVPVKECSQGQQTLKIRGFF